MAASGASEAMDLYDSLYEENGKESLDANAILSFATLLDKNSEYSRALTILEDHLEAIDRSWGTREMQSISNDCKDLPQK